ncbi:acyltransferase [Mangrovimonas sp. YM274]|uniref:acyltransferase family protein n=1 Tax=Mangrovimonas sp. YM274 TaxID=3070660 RepID=UPI0027DB60C6|nr:acyltransferase [Mangrovimonas sp. YM274]WMI69844.1 acyltransferase [Mangrovimonas sp. YM274]
MGEIRNSLKVNQITFTRFIAAISIVVYHYGKDIFPFNLEVIGFLFKKANVAVSYFFFLSGFVLVIAYSNKTKINNFSFIKNRFARLYPVYLLAIILIVIYKAVVNFYNFDLKGMVLNLFMVQSWFPGKALAFNVPAWSLSVEVFFYALFPFFFNSFYNGNKLSKNYILIIISFWVLSQILLHLYMMTDFFEKFASTRVLHEFFHFFPLMHLNEFLIGNLAGFFFKQNLKTWKKDYDKLILINLILLLVFLKYVHVFNYHNGLLLILFLPLVLLISLNSGKITSIFNKPSLIFLGEISYGIYILQLPIYIITFKVFKVLNLNNPTLHFYFYLILLIVLSSLSYKLIENPLREYIKRSHLSGK